MRRLFIIAAICIISLTAHAQSIGCCAINSGAPYTGQAFSIVGYVPDGVQPGATQVMSEGFGYARSTLTDVAVSCQNFYAASNNQEVGLGGVAGVYPPASCTASIEYPIGTCTPFKFSGVFTGTLNGLPALKSDNLIISIPNGALVGFRIYFLGSSGVPVNAEYPPINGVANAGNTGIVDQTQTCGTIVNAGGVDPITPLVEVSTITKPAPCLVGDSIIVGDASTPNVNGDKGIVAPSIGSSMGYVMMGVGSSLASGYASSMAVRQKYVYPYCSHLISGYGANDATIQTQAQVEASLAAIYGGFNGPTFQTTITPRTVTTDGCATLVNQTLESYSSVIAAVNSDLRAGSFGPNGSYFDVAAAVGNGTNFGFWDVSPQISSDCLHTIAAGDTQIVNKGVIQLSRIAH